MTDNLAYRAEMLDVIGRRIDLHPRSLQKRIGPSEFGTPCSRKLGHRLLETPEAAHRSPAWRPTVGTAVHTWLTDAFNAENVHYPANKPRWITSLRVPVGEVDGMVIDGELDLYDAYAKTIVDWKIPGPTAIKNKKRHGPGDEYRIQTHLYGRGATRLPNPLPVERVGILFLSSNGELNDGHYWGEPYFEEVALGALERANGTLATLKLLGTEGLAYLPTAADNCNYCAWMIPGATDLTKACPGDASMQAPTTRESPALRLTS